MAQGIYEGFKAYISLIEEEFINDRLYSNEYMLDSNSFYQYFGDLGERLKDSDLPQFLSDPDENEYYIKVQHGLDKFIFLHTEDLNFILEYSYTDGLEYIRNELTLPET